MESDYPSLPSYPPLPPPVSEESTISESSSPLSINKPTEASSVGMTQQPPVSHMYDRPSPSTQQFGSATSMDTNSSWQHSRSVNTPVQPTPAGIYSGTSSPHLDQHMALHSLHQPLSSASNSGVTMPVSGSNPSSSVNLPISMSSVSNPIPGSNIPTHNVVGPPPPMTSRTIPISGTSTTMGGNIQMSGGTGSTTPSSTDSTSLRLHYLEQLCGKLTKEKKAIEDDFGRQRKKFMNQILQSDAAIAKANSNNESLANEVRELSTQLLLKDEEVKDIRMASKIAESQTREAFDADRVKYEQEIASLRQILSVQTQEHESSLTKEREQWQKEKNKLVEDLKKLKAEEVADHLSPGSRQTSPEGCLETSMAKAALDTQILRSVVVPLEKEVAYLKKQLAEKTEREKELSTLLQEATSKVVNLETPATAAAVGVGDNNGSLREEQSPIPNGGNKLQHQLELERSARHDMETHATQVETQKSVLQEEVKRLKIQLEQMSAEFTVETNAHNELKKTWELANQHFIVAQDKLKNEIYRLHQKLERGQAVSPLRNLSELEMPQVLVKKAEGNESPAQMLSRVHRRSLSTEESSDTNLLSSMQQHRSASCNDIHTAATLATYAATTTTTTNAADIGDLAMKVTSLQTELDGVREELTRRVAMCEGYEKQLLRVQEQMVAELEDKELQIARLKAELEKYKAGIMRERKLRQEMRKQIDGIRDEIGARIQTFERNEREVKQQLGVVNDKFTEITQDTKREIARLKNERGQLHQQMVSAQGEYDCLKVVHAEEMKQFAEMKAGKEEAELNLQTTMEQFTSLQSQASAREENVRKELAQTVEKWRKEKSEFEIRWRDLMTQLERLKQENIALQGLREELETERKGREEAVTSKQTVELKSKQFIANQQQQMETLNKAKESAEQQVRDLQRQLSQLKHHLSHTEETQKDYVELSQSLQRRLAEIEEQRVSISPSPT